MIYHHNFIRHFKAGSLCQTHGPQLQELQLSAENVAGESGEPFATRKFHGDVGGNTPKWMVKIMENPMNPWMVLG